MAITVGNAGIYHYGLGTGSRSETVDIGATAKYLTVLIFNQQDGVSAASDVQWNGVAMTRRTSIEYPSAGGRWVQILDLKDPATGSNNLTFQDGSNSAIDVFMIWASSGIGVSRVGVGSGSGTSGSPSVGSLSTTRPGRIVGLCYHGPSVSLKTIPAGFTRLASEFHSGYGEYIVESSDNTGSRTPTLTGGDTADDWAYVALSFQEDIINVSPPEPFISYVDFPLPTVFAPADVVVQQHDPFVVQVDFPLPSLVVTVPRLLPLVGELAETAGRVPAPVGITDPRLGYDGVEPVWVRGSLGPERVFRYKNFK